MNPAIKKFPIRLFPDRLGKNVAWGIGSHLVGVVIVLATTPFVARGLGSADYGLMSVCIAVGLSIGFAHLMFAKTTSRFIGDALGRNSFEEAAEICTTLRWTSASIGIAAGLALAVSAPWLVDHLLKLSPDKRELAVSALRAQAAYICLQTVASVEAGVVVAYQRLDVFQVIRTLGVAFQGIGWVAFIFCGRGLPAVMWWMTATQTFEWVLYSYWARKLLPTHGNGSGVLDVSKRLGSYGGMLLIGFAVAQMFTPASRLLIGVLSTLEQVAYFSIVITMAGNLRLLCVHIDNALLPAVSERHGGGDLDAVRSAYLRSLRWAWLVLVPIAGIIGFLGDDFVAAWINLEFGAGIQPFLLPLVAGLCVLYISGIPATVLQGLGRPKAWVATVLSTSWLNIIIGMLLIPKLGAKGASYAILVAGFLLTTILLLRVSHVLQIPLRRYIHALDARVLVTTGIIGTFFDHLPKFHYGLVAISCIGAGACFMMLVVTPLWLSREETAAVRQFLGG